MAMTITHWIRITALTVTLCCPAIQASHHLDQEIASLKSKLAHDKQRQHSASNQVQAVEVKIGKISAQLHHTQNRLMSQQKLLSDLQRQQNSYQKNIQQQKQQLANQMQASYLIQRKNPMVVLLNQKDPQQLQRVIYYLRALNKKQSGMIQTLNRTLNELNKSEHQMRTYTTALNTLMSDQVKQRKNLQHQKHLRSRRLSQLKRQIRTKKQKLAELVANKKHLDSIVQTLPNKTVKGGKSALIHKGKLPWPIHGQLLQSFNRQVLHSHLRTNGILISAKEGAQVKAVASGEVVFADWMPGFGLLMIINHGNGYMSLYGRNSSLFQQKGDTVRAGEAIALAGNSGGFEKTALYFALRNQGEPVDPLKWLTT